MSNTVRPKGFTFFSVWMGLACLFSLGYIELLINHKTTNELFFGISSVLYATLSGISCIGLWKVKRWVFNVMILWAISILPVAVTMKLSMEEHEMFNQIGWLHMGVLFLVNIFIVFLVLRYIKKALNRTYA